MHEPSENSVPSVPHAFKPLSTKTYVVLTAFILLIILVSVFATTLSFSSNATRTDRLILLPIALLLLLVPGRFVQITIRRRRKTGLWTLQPSSEERAAYFARHGQQPPQQARRISILSWLSDGMMLSIGLINLWQLLRPNHAPLDGGDRFLVGLWMLMLALYLFIIYRTRRQKPTATD